MIRSSYKKLLRKFGHQGWWPTTPKGSTTPRYVPRRSVAKRTGAEKFEICLGAILTQNTNWSNVVRGLENISRSNRLSFRRLRDCPPDRLAVLLRPTGYYRQKTRRIKNFILHLARRHNGMVSRLLGRPLAAAREELLGLKGIGPETADSMLLYAGGRPVFVVDSYTRRIAVRWGVVSETDNYDKIQRIFVEQLPRSAEIYGEYHALLVELAKRHCRTKPVCDDCPVRADCATGRRKN